MKTQIFSSKQIKQAANIIKSGELVSFPTETVYGLGGNALNSSSAKKIFEAKGRTSDNPLIVHISNKDQLDKIAKIPNSKKELIDKITKKFWPGPLTIILKKKSIIPLETSGGLDTVAIRMPKNKIALKLIELSKVPIAAPSANLSGKPSGTSFEHVYEDFNERISGIVKSKNATIGLESTVIDLSTNTPYLLRPGKIGYEELSKVIPNIVKGGISKSDKVKSPGMKYKHYSPDAKIVLFEKSVHNKIKDYAKDLESKDNKVRIIKSKKTQAFSKSLFSLFRDSDKQNYDYILITSVEETGIGLAIMNRIRKAASKIIK